MENSAQQQKESKNNVECVHSCESNSLLNVWKKKSCEKGHTRQNHLPFHAYAIYSMVC